MERTSHPEASGGVRPDSVADVGVTANVPHAARYRAPAESGQKLVVPAWPELPNLLAANRRWRAEHDFELLGRPLSELTADARREIAERASGGAAASRGDARPRGLEARCAAPWIVTGHQPGLVHPGVWVKNFAAAELAARHAGVGLHVIIDADLCRTPAITVPAGTVGSPRFASVEYDRVAPAMPWEERRIGDDALWRSFPERVQDTCGELASQPLLDEWWPIAIDRAGATGLVGASLAQARQATEIAWNAGNAELPQSQLCQTAAFRHFVCTLLAELPRLVAAYNGVLVDYRRRRRIRNHAHPVPNLAADGPWLEAPLWIWTVQDPKRRPVFVRSAAGGLLVSDRRNVERLLPLSGPADAAAAVAALGDWEAAGVKVRSRALITTLFTRLVVADLFLHGIGGAKYDEATDDISARFFGAAPPAFAAMSGTLRLPIDRAATEGDDAGRLRTQLRELTYHPERQLAASILANGQRAAAAEIVAEKTHWVRTPKRPETALQRHQAIVAANARLQPFVAVDRATLERRLAAASQQHRAHRVLAWREYAFCLFPRKNLVQFLLDFATWVR
jgi:hypothetical protein